MSNSDKEFEEWRPVVGYEGIYEVSCSGRVKNVKTGRILKRRRLYGYLILGLCKNNTAVTHRVHRVVAKAFLKNPDNKPQVNHINGVKDDNRVENLYWCTQQENFNHAKENGLILKGADNPNSTLSESDVLEIIEGLSDGFKQKDIARYYNVTATNINAIAKGKSWGWLTGVRGE